MTEYDGTAPGEYVWRGTATYNVNYVFKSESADKALPAEVTKLLPAEATENYDEEIVNSPELSATELTTADGKWTFKGWDKSTATISGADEVVTGLWAFTPKSLEPAPPTEPEPVPEPNPNPNPNPNPTPDPNSNPAQPIPGPGQPSPSEPQASNDQQSQPKQEKTLPKAGDTDNYYLASIGFVLLGILSLTILSQIHKKN
jgi:LPXTG-motif cell wall-anchored protein